MKTVLITGANRGLGLGFTRHYLSAGCRVFAAARNPGECDEFADLRRENGEQLVLVELDVSDEASINAMSAQLSDVELDLVINNAGTCPDQAFGQWSRATFEAAMAVNLVGPALVAQALVPLIKEGGVLANLSSGLGSCALNINPETGLDAYAASKAALNMITRRLAAKPEARNITVVGFDPGWVKTRMGGDEAELSVEESIGGITTAIGQLAPQQSGLFLDRNGESIPW